MSNGEGFSDPTADLAIHNVMKKSWREMTDHEILKNKRERCQYCEYAYQFCGGLSNMLCDYLGQEEHSRGCRPDECDKFKPAKGKKRRRRAMNVKKGSK